MYPDSRGFTLYELLVTLGLALKDSPPGFDPGAAVYFSDEDDDEDLGYAEDEQL